MGQMIVVLVTQSCPALRDPWAVAHQIPLPMEILQARILEWIAFPSPTTTHRGWEIYAFGKKEYINSNTGKTNLWRESQMSGYL